MEVLTQAGRKHPLTSDADFEFMDSTDTASDPSYKYDYIIMNQKFLISFAELRYRRCPEPLLDDISCWRRLDMERLESTWFFQSNLAEFNWSSELRRLSTR